jgi:hypothetical protein
MATPTTKSTFKEYCLRKLGKPVIEINVDDDQVDDRVDEAIRYYWDYHFDGSEKIYYKYEITGREKPGSVYYVTINSGGTSYSNSDTVSVSGGTGATGTIITYANGTINSISFTAGGSNYNSNSVLSITTSTGSNANVSLTIGDGFILMPENIIGAVGIFGLSDPLSSSNDMFNIRYQIALNDLYTLTNVSVVPYYMAMQHLGVLSEILVGNQPIRYTRHRDRLYVDTDWGDLTGYIIVEAYEVVDPEVWTDAWNDRWLQNYATALIKQQWGANLTKFTGMVLPGGVQFNGEKIYNDATDEVRRYEQEMISSFSMPVLDMIG